ncbi:phosphoenolpyruvate carboxylase [bacterium]|nr:phosphoenolpyruvate carboxylase [bacterium]
MRNDEQLQGDVRRLSDLLNEIIAEDAGAEAVALIEEIRHLARDRRANVSGAESKLAERITSLTEDQASLVARALSIFFDLTNIAEDRQRVRVLRKREQDRHPEPISESIGNSILQLKGAGLSAREVQEALDNLDIELVFTAHPSEAKRRSIRAKLRRMRQCLVDLDRTDLLPRERSAVESRLRADLTALWQTEFLRPMRPSVLEEVERGLSIMPRLWEVVPPIYEALRNSLSSEFPEHEFNVPRFLRFGSWVGGDRDGHPDVTWQITERTLIWLRDTAIERHLEWCKKLYDFLSIAGRTLPSEDKILKATEEAEKRWPAYAGTLARVPAYEVYRRWIKLIEWRLRQSRCKSISDPALDGAYLNGAEFVADVEAMIASLPSRHGESSLSLEARRWFDLARVFGLHLTSLDIRQDANRYRDVMAELFSVGGECPNFAELDENARQEVLLKTLGNVKHFDEEKLSPLTQEVLGLFRMLRRAFERFGTECLGGHVVSMTRTPSDLLTVLWFWRRACAEIAPNSTAYITALRIVPLFEKIGDLRSAPQTMAAILDQPVYAEHLRAQDNRQIVMVGYSDSTKDGGYLAACWGLDHAQDSLHQVAVDRNVRFTFFHGRGGSLGRGGGPAARGILSLPPDALGGSLRLTEQGEVLAERYDDVQVAYRHLEQVTWATLVASNIPRPPVLPEWRELMDSLAVHSLKAYRELVDTPGFIEFFGEATPIEEIENLPIASRPSRRTGRRTLNDLRAIPWVFAWTQNRCMIPAWYGLGAGLSHVKYNDRAGWQTVLDMYRQWPFFQATIDNAATALAKADMYVGQCYSELCSNAEQRQHIWMLIASERDRSRQAILDLVGGSELLATTPWFQSSIEIRNPDVDPLNLIQVELLRRRRKLDNTPDDKQYQHLRELLRLSLQGVAAGMRTTG